MRTLKTAGLITISLLLLYGCSGERPDEIGPIGGVALAECPSTPNCVTSQTDDEDQYVAPLEYRGPPNRALRTLADVIRRMPRSKIITMDESRGYIHAEFASELLGFVDDVEFLIDPASDHIHVRSAARLGYSDLGVNRERLEKIREYFETRLTAHRTGEEASDEESGG